MFIQSNICMNDKFKEKIILEVLLLDSDATYCINLLNAISSLSSTVRISFIAHNLKEILHTFNPDIILADYEFCNGELEIKFSNCAIIYLSEEYDLGFETISKTDIDSIIKTIEEHSKDISDAYLEKLIIGEISFLGYNFSHVGTQHLIEALKILYKCGEDCYNINLQKDIYPELAKNFCISLRTLKGNINYSTNKMLDECEKKKLSSYLGFNLSKRPGAKTIMCAILEKIKLRI